MTRYSFPKIDLHLHLDGSMLPETAWEMAREQGVALPAPTLEEFRRFIVVSSDCRSVNEYLKRFAMPLALLQKGDALERTARELIALLAGQGLAYAEIRFAPQLHLEQKLSQQDAVQAVLRGVREGLVQNPSMDAGVILCAMCVGPAVCNEKQNFETVRVAKEYLDKGVAAVDLAGAEGVCPLSDFAPVFALAKELQVPFTCHAGDSQGPETVKAAMDFGSRRIGHGHHIIEDRALLARAVAEGVTLEICPTSNIQCQSQPSYEAHPLKKLINRGVSCTINTDNMILSDITLDKEYDHCIQEMGLTVGDVIRCNCNSVKAAFMKPEKKLLLLEKLLRALDECGE